MRQRAEAVIVGLAIYGGLSLVLYGLHALALPGGSGDYPVWYEIGEQLLNSLKAVGPGLAAGWISGARGVSTGATVGAVGGFSEVVLVAAMANLPFDPMPPRIVLAALTTLIAGAITNGIGGIAGEALRRRSKPSNPLMQPTVRERPASD